MRRIAVSALLIAAIVWAKNTNPPTGQAADASVAIAAYLLDAAAIQQAAGSDFSKTYTVIEVTVTPKGAAPLVLQPDDFLLRVGSTADSSGPMAASQVYGEGSALVLQHAEETIGITRSDPGYSGLTVQRGSGTASKAAVAALQAKMLPAKTTSDPVTGLLFFPIAKKKARDLDLVYTSPDGKLHIRFR